MSYEFLKDVFHGNFSRIYKERWKAAGKTQSEFAEAVGGDACHVNSVSNWLSGKQYPQKYIDKIAEVLGVDKEEFFRQSFPDKVQHDPKLASMYTGMLEKNAAEIGLDDSLVDYLLRTYGERILKATNCKCMDMKNNPELFKDEEFLKGYAVFEKYPLLADVGSVYQGAVVEPGTVKQLSPSVLVGLEYIQNHLFENGIEKLLYDLELQHDDAFIRIVFDHDYKDGKATRDEAINGCIDSMIQLSKNKVIEKFEELERGMEWHK